MNDPLDWWGEEPLPPPEHCAHVYAAKASLHDEHVRLHQEIRTDAAYERMGFRRVKMRPMRAEDIVVQPMMSPVPLTFAMRM
jgi:hypothetical protein